MRQDFRDEGAEQTAGQHARQDFAEQPEIMGENLEPPSMPSRRQTSVAQTATSAPMKIIDQPTGLRARGRLRLARRRQAPGVLSEF